MQKYILSVLIASLLISPLLFAQNERKDRAVYIETKNEFLDSIKVEAEKFKKKEAKAKPELKLDFTGINAPASPAEFTQYWHNPPISQGLSGMCWCFSTTSFFESEVYRLTKRELKLSELYTVYWEYVEKARRFVQERGNSEFGEGSEDNAVIRIWSKYGIVPSDAFTGMKHGQKFHDHEAMFAEMRDFLTSVKNQNAWDEEGVVRTIQSIMNHYIGAPPQSITIGEKTMTPAEYFRTVVRLNLDDYAVIMSTMEMPYYQRGELEVPDNWWHSKDYYNVPLDDFMAIIKSAIRSGHTVGIGGDVSEPGLYGHAGVAVIPTFDIPSAFIDESARQMRISNGTTTDDHGIHLVGFVNKEGKDWYLIKDSGSGSRNNSHPGYYFYHEDFVKLKMLSMTVHKEVAKEILAKFSH
ncbi:MAG TPA: C1 family peptidase [Bacteroidota bacterium]|nr:C1 family peptidase [Bacteroidota bacterium]